MHDDAAGTKISAAPAIFLWGVVAAGLTYGVFNTIKSVIDLFAG
jgi:hypothetical protein